MFLGICLKHARRERKVVLIGKTGIKLDLAYFYFSWRRLIRYRIGRAFGGLNDFEHYRLGHKTSFLRDFIVFLPQFIKVVNKSPYLIQAVLFIPFDCFYQSFKQINAGFPADDLPCFFRVYINARSDGRFLDVVSDYKVFAKTRHYNFH